MLVEIKGQDRTFDLIEEFNQILPAKIEPYPVRVILAVEAYMRNSEEHSLISLGDLNR